MPHPIHGLILQTILPVTYHNLLIHTGDKPFIFTLRIHDDDNMLLHTGDKTVHIQIEYTKMTHRKDISLSTLETNTVVSLILICRYILETNTVHVYRFNGIIHIWIHTGDKLYPLNNFNTSLHIGKQLYPNV